MIRWAYHLLKDICSQGSCSIGFIRLRRRGQVAAITLRVACCNRPLSGSSTSFRENSCFLDRTEVNYIRTVLQSRTDVRFSPATAATLWGIAAYPEVKGNTDDIATGASSSTTRQGLLPRKQNDKKQGRSLDCQPFSLESHLARVIDERPVLTHSATTTLHV
jgi:hypothetical protein